MFGWLYIIQILTTWVKFLTNRARLICCGSSQCRGPTQNSIKHCIAIYCKENKRTTQIRFYNQSHWIAHLVVELRLYLFVSVATLVLCYLTSCHFIIRVLKTYNDHNKVAYWQCVFPHLYYFWKTDILHIFIWSEYVWCYFI